MKIRKKFHMKELAKMTKYILVEWPEMQKFQDLPNYEDECYEHESGMVTFVPEDLYNEVMNPFELPDEYKENFTLDFERINKGQKVLVEDIEDHRMYTVEAEANWIGDSMPVILTGGYLPGINCYIVAVEKTNG